MQWYYKSDVQRIGPVTDEDIKSLVESGTITASTPVWNDLTGKWIPYGEVAGEGAAATVPTAASTAATAACAECGRMFPLDEMVRYGKYAVCAACKPIFFQKVKEGASLPNSLPYAGFWIRFGAKFIDNIILYAVNTAISITMAAMVAARAGEPRVFGGAMLAVLGLQIAVSMSYTTLFVGKFQATPGKMAVGVKIVMPDGGRVGYGRALGRYFAEILSGMTLCIGYLMAAFDQQERRTLHDRICTTRVIKKQP